jgi:hypothetical protein
MLNDLDAIEAVARSNDYAIDNPKKILKMDPDRSGNRESGGSFRRKQSDTQEQSENPPDESGTSREPCGTAVDSVVLSSDARQASGIVEASNDQTRPPPVTTSDNSAGTGHVDITA